MLYAMCSFEIANATSPDETGGICVSHSPSSVHASQPPAAQAVENLSPVRPGSGSRDCVHNDCNLMQPEKCDLKHDFSGCVQLAKEDRRLHCSCPVKSAGLKSNPPNSTAAAARARYEYDVTVRSLDQQSFE